MDIYIKEWILMTEETRNYRLKAISTYCFVGLVTFERILKGQCGTKKMFS